jgi:putative ABC transport system permease protein
MSFQIDLALHYLSARKLRTLLTTLAIILGVMITFGLNSLAPPLKAAFQQSIQATSLNIDLILSQKTMGMFDRELVDVVAAVPGVTDVSGVINRDIFLPEDSAFASAGGGAVTTLDIYGLDPGTAAYLFDLVLAEGRDLVEGRVPQPGDGNVVVISQEFAEGSNLDLGDRLVLPSARGTIGLEIIGLLGGSSLNVGEEQLFMPLKAAQEVFNAPGLINMITAQNIPGVDGEAVQQAVLTALGPGYQAGSLGGGAEAWETMMGMIDLILTLFGVLALAMAGFILFNTFRTIVVERKRDIGMLRAVGASRRTVMGLVMIESLLLGLVGTGLGLLAGYAFAKLMAPLLGQVMDIFFHTPFGDAAFALPNFLLSIGLGIGIPLLSGLIPARSATRVTPLDALRPAAAGAARHTAGRRALSGGILFVLAFLGLLSGLPALSGLGMVLFLAGILVLGPTLVGPLSQVFGRLLTLIYAREGRLAQGNLVRQPERAAVTATTITISLAILIALAGMTTSITDGMLQYLDKSLQSDFLLLPESLFLGQGNVGAGPELAQAVRETDGVAGVTAMRQVDALVNGTGVQLVGVDPVTYPQFAGLVFFEGEPEVAYARLGQGRAIVVNSILAKQNGVDVGQTLTLQTASGPQAYEVVGIGLDYLNAKAAAGYISHATMAQDFLETGDVLILIELAEGVDRAQVQNGLLAAARDYPAFSLLSFEQLRDSQLQAVQGQKLGMIMVVAMLAVPSLLALANTLGINVLERTREIGMMRAVGATRRQVRRMIVAESLLLSAMGVAFGILAGLWMGYVLVGAMSFTGLPLAYFFPYAGILIAIAVGLLLGVLAALLPARHAARLDIVAALAYE